MLRAPVVISLLLLALFSGAQDLIVTTRGDSIKCTISTVTPNRLFFTVQMEDYRRPDNIALEDVAMYKRDGYFPVIMGDVRSERSKEVAPPEEHGWLMSGSFGFSHRTAPIDDGLPSELEDYVNGQRSGLHASGTLHYFVTDGVAIGLQYNGFFGARNSMPITVLLDDSTTLDGVLAEDVRLRYLGLDFLFRPIRLRSVTPFGAVSLGRLVFEDRATLINNFTITGSALALNVRAGLECSIGPKLSVGVSVGYFISRISRVEVDTGSQKSGFTLPDRGEENVDRVDVGLVARVRL